MFGMGKQINFNGSLEMPTMRKPPVIVLDDMVGTLAGLEPFEGEDELNYYVDIDHKAKFYLPERIRVNLPIPESVIRSAIYRNDPIDLLFEPIITLPCNRGGKIIKSRVARITCPTCDAHIEGSEFANFVQIEKDNVMLKREVLSLRQQLEESKTNIEAFLLSSKRISDIVSGSALSERQ